METFAANFKKLTIAERKAKLEQITMFLRQQNAHVEAEAFQTLKACYPTFALSSNERAFQEHFAWCEIADVAGHPAVKHVIAQG
jgi:uncharacterized FlgJ-related protein